MARILHPDEQSVALAVTQLAAGKPIGLPTETVYGLAGDATSEEAVLAIYKTKARPSFDPLIVHVAPGIHSVEDLALMELVDTSRLDMAQRAKVNQLIHEFWPGPLTLILPKHSRVSDLITSGLPMVGIRMPDHPVAQEVLRSFGRPLAAPSANRFGRISPTSAADVDAELGQLIDLILDGGPCARGVESTVIGVAEGGGFNLLRPGSLPAEAVESLLGEKLRVPSAASSAASPGTLASHYAPGKKFLLLPKPLAAMTPTDWFALGIDASLRVSLLIPCGYVDGSLLGKVPLHVVEVRHLSPEQDERKASRQLFRSIRELDAGAGHVILCEPVTLEGGLWIAIRDRLNRATQRV
jgi:L-threonylcarbamoyladenylate synthase